MTKYLLAAASVLVLAACEPKEAPNEPKETGATPTAEAPVVNERKIETAMSSDFGAFGLDLTSRKDSVHPGDNFYEHVNGKWLETFEMPADRSRYGSFTLLREMSEQRVRHIIEDLAAAETESGTLEGKISDYYNAFMDMEAIEAAGLSPAQPFLDAIQAADTHEDLAVLFATVGYASPVGGWVDVDSRQTDKYIYYMQQSGLGIGDRDYYIKDDDKSAEAREAYVKLVTTLLEAAGYENAADSAQAVLALETKMAGAHWDRAVGRNRNLTYNKMSRDELAEYAGDFALGAFLEKAGLEGQTEFVVRQITPTAEEIDENGLNEDQVEKLSGGGIGTLMALAASEDVDVWKAWLTAQFLSDHAFILPKSIDDANFEFYGKTLRGQEEQRERWKRGVQAVEGALGEGVGKVYAARHFTPEHKAEMDKLVANLRRAMASNLDDITWMSDDTKVEARDKLSKFTPKIGYTEKFETYDSLNVSAESAFNNQIASDTWAYRDQIGQLGQPIDKTEWFMLPQTVNAYYSPNRNEIVFPAGILQPPFFNLTADPAINYGAIGGVIGHEIGHGFDDQGAKSDGNGVLRNWWTDEDNAAFKARTEALVAQYNGHCPLDDGETCVNGALSLGENVGDLGGLSMAYRAYKMSLNGEEAPVIDGLTGDQRFFMAWAQVWRNKYRDEALRRQLRQGPHSPPRYRVNGIVRNFDEWYEAFDIGPDHALYLPPEERIRIW